MSETTRKLRAFKTYSVGVRDLAADAIEAVEAQVAEAVARVAALEKKFVTTTDKIEPAPSAAPSPRGFKRGDVVRTGGLSPFDTVVVEVREPQRKNWNVTIKADRGTYKWHGPDLTLVRAADAPEAPAEDWKARAEAADIRADGHAEGLRSIRKMLTQSPPDVDRAILWCDDSLSGYTQSVAATEAETNDRALASEARAEAAEKERDDARAISAATVERVRNETQIATELRKDLDDLRAKLALAEKVIDVERRTGWTSYTGDGSDLKPQVHRTIEDHHAAEQSWWQSFQATRKERDALRAELDAAQGEMCSLRATISVLRADLDTLKAKPRFRTRKVTAEDLDALRVEYLKPEYKYGYEHEARAANALGFRRVVTP